MMYLLLKAVHVAAVIAWIGGLLLQSLALKTATGSAATLAGYAQFLEGVRRWDSRVTSPAMGLAWLLGIVMALQAGWFATGWLNVKLAIVVGLSALHGMQAGQLSRLAASPAASSAGSAGRMPPLILAAALGIAVLVIVKPFS